MYSDVTLNEKWWEMIYLSTAIGLTPSGSITVHIYTQIIHKTTQIQATHRTRQITTYLEQCGPWPVFASFTPAFVLQLRKKHGKTSVRVTEEWQYTYYTLTKQPHITKLHTYKHTPTHYKITHTHTPKHYKTQTYTQSHIKKPTHTHTPTRYKTNTHTHTHTHTHTQTPTHTHNHTLQYPHIHTHTLQNPHIHTPTHYKTHTYTHPHITKPTHTHTHTLQNPHLSDWAIGYI